MPIAKTAIALGARTKDGIGGVSHDWVQFVRKDQPLSVPSL